MAEVNQNIESKVESLNKKLVNIGVQPITYSSQTDLASKSTSKSQELSQLCRDEYAQFIDVSTIMDTVQTYITEQTDMIRNKVTEKMTELSQSIATKAAEAATNAAMPSSGIAVAVKVATDITTIVQQVQEQIQKIQEQITDRIERLTINSNIVAANAVSFAIEKAQKAKKKTDMKNKLQKIRNKE